MWRESSLIIRRLNRIFYVVQDILKKGDNVAKPEFIQKKTKQNNLIGHPLGIEHGNKKDGVFIKTWKQCFSKKLTARYESEYCKYFFV